MKHKLWKIATLLVVAMLFFTTNVFADTKPTLYVEDTVKYQDSDEVTVKICMKNVNSKLCTLTMDVNYDNSKLEYVSSKAGSDVSASFKLAENVADESRVAIGLISFSGFDTNGTYYTVTFKVLDASSDIKVGLSVREATDSSGNDISITTRDGTIDVGAKEEKPEEEVSPTGQKIENFEVTDVNQLETLEELITENGDVEVAEADNLVYEVEDSSIVEILEDGTIIPVSDGTTNVRVKLNGETVGNVALQVQDGKVTKISATDEELDFEATATVGVVSSSSNGGSSSTSNQSSNTVNANSTNSSNSSIENSNDENSVTTGNQAEENNTVTNQDEEGSSNKVKIIIIVIVVIIILSLMFIKIKKQKKGGN